MASTIYPIVLAAGLSHRFGSDKLVASLGEKPVLAHVLHVISQARDADLLAGGVVITGPHSPLLDSMIAASGLERLTNPDPASGLSHSLLLGLGLLADRYPQADGALVCAGDQPGIRLSTIEAIVTKWLRNETPVVRPRYLAEKEVPGHPVLIGRDVWKLASALQGDVGFGAILKKYPELVTTVDIPGPNPDIDTPDDLRRFAEPL
ncbi:MAG: nucleotidyltransferase family protein [Gemmatimonadota bacterium]